MSPISRRKKNGGHFERRAAIGRRNTAHHSYTSGRKKVPVCIGNIVLTRQFSEIFRLLALKNI